MGLVEVHRMDAKSVRGAHGKTADRSAFPNRTVIRATVSADAARAKKANALNYRRVPKGRSEMPSANV